MENPQIKLGEEAINEKNPWSDDKLKRQEAAKDLTNLLENQEDALTISLNGAWGSGKTFMLKRWQQQLKNDGYFAIYFNAWEDDFLNDPFVAIIGQLWKELRTSSLRELCQTVKDAAIPFLKRAGVSLLNKGFEKLTRTNLATITEEELKTASESAFDEYVSLIGYREDLKRRLQDLADSIFTRNGKPLIFIIDELDRCRPTFAIEVLERIKHLFHIKHIIFVLGIDRKQLGKSIQAVYGEIDVENYLHRFIDLDFSVPQNNPKVFFNALWERYNISQYLADKANFENYTALDINEGGFFKDFCFVIMHWYHFSLREIEQVLKIYVILLRSTEPHHYTWPYLAPVLIFLKLRKPELYQHYITKRCSVAEVVDAVIPVRCPEEEDRRAYVILIAVIYASFVPYYYQDDQKTAIKEFIEQVRQRNPLSASPYCAQCMLNKDERFYQRFIELFSNFHDPYRSGGCYNSETLQWLANKIDLIKSGSSDS